MNRKSSINFLDAEKKHNFFEKMIYLMFFCKELILEKKNKRDYLFPINTKDLSKFWGNEECWQTLSPCRIASDSYLIYFLKNNFKRKKVSILDLGCGSGRYAKMIENSGFKINYLGIDIKENKNWKNTRRKNINFLIYKFGTKNYNQLLSIKKKFTSADLIFTHSVLEHVKFDVEALKEITNIYPDAIQLHFIPAVFSFYNYFIHGYRRYTYSSLKKLNINLSKKISIIPLGNNQSLKLFFSWYYKIVKKKHKFDFFDFYKKEYNIKNNIRDKLCAKNNQYPLFYSITII